MAFAISCGSESRCNRVRGRTRVSHVLRPRVVTTARQAYQASHRCRLTVLAMSDIPDVVSREMVLTSYVYKGEPTTRPAVRNSRLGNLSGLRLGLGPVRAVIRVSSIFPHPFFTLHHLLTIPTPFRAPSHLSLE
jgi:hypothetical protein